MADKNFMSWDGGGDDPPHHDVVVDMPSAGIDPMTRADAAKFHKRVSEVFWNITITVGGNEDAVDANNGCNDNTFQDFHIIKPGATRVLTLKGGSSRNTFLHWTVWQHAKVVDIEVGDWSSYNISRSRENVFVGWKSMEGRPFTYAYRLGCKPLFRDMQVKHLWWRSIGLTVYWWAKYVWHVVLRRPDPKK